MALVSNSRPSGGGCAVTRRVARGVLTIALLGGMLAALAPAPLQAQDLVVYSGRSNSLVDPIIQRFQEETGLRVEVRYGGTTPLALAIQQEGARSPADVFWAQDTGALEALAKAGLFAPLPEGFDSNVLEPFRSQDGTWVATTARARVLAYSPERVSDEELPKSIFDLTDPKWKGRVGWAPTNASFQAFVTALRSRVGEEKTREWLLGMKANETKAYARNSPILDAIAAGEVDLGLPNHYYLLGMKKENPNFPVEQTHFEAGDIGNLVFVAGAGVLKSSKRQETARKFIEYLISSPIQADFTTRVNEYPVTVDAKPATTALDPTGLGDVAPEVEFSELQDLDGTLELLRAVGLL